tara:strand:+ start:282 stop:449 length:168 start_codon:yes stop_codon:yes gene_type:complete
MPWNPDHYKNITWNTGLAAERARHNLKLKKKKKAPGPEAASCKRQASSLKEDTIK